jgi:hypothetical protein
MRGNLSVRVVTPTTDRFVTDHVTDLRYRKTAPGGHHSASCKITVPRDLLPDLGPDDRLIFYEARTGATMWEGNCDNPGVTDGPGGQSFDVTAMGGMVLASDQTEKLPYIDASLDQWRKDDEAPQTPSGTGDASQFPADAGTRAGDPGLFCQFTPGQPITDLDQTGVIYSAFEDSAMALGGFAGFYDGGKDDTNFNLEWVARPYIAGDGLPAVTLAALGSRIAAYAGTDIPTGKTALTFRLIRRAGGATTVATDNAWSCFGEVSVLGQLYDRYTADRPMATTAHVSAPGVSPVVATVLASEVVEDLLGRLLIMCDPVSAVIDTTTFGIDQFAYHDGATAAEVLDDLGLFEPDFLWEIGGSVTTAPSPGRGLHRFAFRAWPTVPRYEISVRDGYVAPGGEVDLCNRIAVSWSTPKGVKRSTIVTSVVPALGDTVDEFGVVTRIRIRDAEPVALPDGLGSLGHANRIGSQILATKNTPPRAATATVRRPIMDRLLGRLVMPWEIEPGYMAQVGELSQSLRVTETEYVDKDAATDLTLGAPPRTVEQLIAHLTKRGRR